MGKFEYRLGNPVSSVFEPKDSVTEKDYYDFFKEYSRIEPGFIKDIVRDYNGYMEFVSRSGQDFIVVTAGTEKFADTLMEKLSNKFSFHIMINRNADTDSYGVSLEKLAKINYVKHNPDSKPVLAFQGGGAASSGYYNG